MASLILENFLDLTVVGVDPYPGMLNEKTFMLRRLERLGVLERFKLVSDVQELNFEDTFEVIHVDGLHTESGVWNDLVFSESVLSERGVIIVDDYRHEWFPGIASALFRFLDKYDMRIFMTSPNKAYVCRTKEAPFFYTSMKESLFNHSYISSHRWIRDWETPPYIQSPAVLEQEILLCFSKTHLENFKNAIQVARETIPTDINLNQN